MRIMQTSEEKNTNRCDFKDCIHYEDGICLSEEARAYCLEIAYAVLCKNKDIEE